MDVVDFLSLRITSDTPIVPTTSGDIATGAASVYFKAAALDTVIRYYTNAFIASEIKTSENDEEKRGELYYKLNVKPNPNQSAAQYKEKMMYKLLYSGEMLSVQVKDGFYVADSFGWEQRPLRSDRFTSVTVESLGLNKTFTADNAIYMTFGNQKVRALVDGIYREYSALMSAALSSYEQSHGNKWILSMDVSPTGDRTRQKSDDDERNDPRNMLQTFMRKANAVYFQTRGQSLEHVSINGASADDIIKIRKECFEVVASIFHIPPPMLFGNMTNLKDNVNMFLTFGFNSIAQQFEQEATAKFLTPIDWYNGSRIVVNTSRIKAVDIFENASSISQLLGAGFSLDELRDTLNWPLIGTPEAKEHMITRNFAPIEDMLRQIAQGGE